MKTHQQNLSRLVEDKPGIIVEFECRFQQKNGRKKISKEKKVHNKPPSLPSHHIHQTAKLLTLAHYYQNLIEDGALKNYAEIARLTGTSRARISQIISLTFLAPEIQEKILNLHEVKNIKTERRIRMIAGIKLWKKQLELWND